MEVLGGIFEFGGSTMNSGVLAQSTSGLANLLALTAGNEWRSHSRCRERTTYRIERKVRAGGTA